MSDMLTKQFMLWCTHEFVCILCVYVVVYCLRPLYCRFLVALSLWTVLFNKLWNNYCDISENSFYWVVVASSL